MPLFFYFYIQMELMTSKAYYINSQKLPLESYTIFVDWHGVLCGAEFWSDILNNVSHPYYFQVKNYNSSLFSSDNKIVVDWMKGILSSESVLKHCRNFETTPKLERSILRELKLSCMNMKCDSGLLNILKKYRSLSKIVIATDNMDCFYDCASRIENINFFDTVLCSSQLGVLKKENPKKFFLEWLTINNIKIQNSILIDDNIDNCNRFKQIGGTAIIHKSNLDTALELEIFFKNKTTLAQKTNHRNNESFRSTSAISS